MDDLEFPFSGDTVAWAEDLYARFLEDPLAVPADWRRYFTAALRAPGDSQSGGRSAQTLQMQVAARQDRVDQLIRAYRVRGHMIADLDPLGLHGEPHPELELDHYELSETDLDRVFSSRTIGGGGTQTLREILQLLRKTYCGSVGVQFMHIDNLRIKEWLQSHMEDSQNVRRLSRREQFQILAKLTDAEILEDFLQKKFLGAKRFSLEGGETLIPLMDNLIDEAARHGVEEVVIGMAHRGRLNVLVNVLEKSPAQIFREFADTDPELHIGSGDVKYHLGRTAEIKTFSGRRVQVTLCFNPSHLEFVNPVVVGRVRARAKRLSDHAHDRTMGIVVHGDAAFSGEGVVQETLNMSGLPGYTTGGTIHVIVNNQIGFTTPPELARTSPYATCVAKMLQIPIFHVNGEHPEAVAQVLQLAMDFRSTFRRDVVIDMFCYRRYGHNEGDDPAFTQPVLTRAIKRRKSVREGYIESLLKLGALTAADCQRIAVDRREHLESELLRSQARGYRFQTEAQGDHVWEPYVGGDDEAVPRTATGVPLERLSSLLEATTKLPDDFAPHPRIKRLLKLRAAMARGERPLDWGAAEALAFASLVADGTQVRLTGQDCGRGTFSHRHAILYDYDSGRKYMPLRHLDPDQAEIEIWDSPLSENGPLGFEFGYSLDTPDALVLWEAQFGDFANTAQVVIDQFIVSSEDKWKRLSGLVLLLPHGFEGQGPEHSSARLERFLTMCAEDNIQVVNLTTPAQLFHCLRRQIVRPWRKPLIVMSPKSLLRHPRATSPIEDLSGSGRFQRIIGDPLAAADRVHRVILCTGKIYYELLAERERLEADERFAILRLEQLYPLSDADLEAALEPYASDVETVWVQEEPANKGAWPALRFRFGDAISDRPLRAITREASASPATGSTATHTMIQARLIAQAFGAP